MRKKTALGFVLLISTLPFLAFAQRDIACSITATPARAAPGEQVTLHWNSQNARSATLVGFGPVPASGSRVVQATQTTDYKIMVSGYENNHVGCIARITVTAKQPTCNMSLVPFAVASNNFATLSWSTDYADSVYISGIGNVQPKGNQMVRAVGNTIYYLSARGAGGICERSAELTVRDPYQAFGYFPQTIQNIAYPLYGYSAAPAPQPFAPKSYSSYSSQNYYPKYDSYETYWYKDQGVYDGYGKKDEYAPYWNTSSTETSPKAYSEYDDTPKYEQLYYPESNTETWQNQPFDTGVETWQNQPFNSGIYE